MTGGRLRGYLPVVATFLVLSGIPLVLGRSGYLLSLASAMLLSAGYGIGFNVLFGLTGQLLLCVGALAGVAGYTSVILTDDRGWPALASMALGVGLATLLGAGFSWVSVRRDLQTIFVGIVTLAFSLAATNLAQGWRALTGGETGRVVVADGGVPTSRIGAYHLLVAVVVAFLFAFRWIERSHLGWAFRALKDDPVAAQLAGIDVARYQVVAGAIGSAMIGTMGALFAHHEAFISPASYAFTHVDVRVIVLVFFGGVGSLLGPVVGAAALSVLDESLRGLGQLRLAVYGSVLIGLFLWWREGLVPALAARLRVVMSKVGRSRLVGRET